MVLRTLVLYPVGFVGEVVLARLLAPEDFGVYALASFVTVTLAAVLEVGLAASLIQRPDEPRDEEYQTLFTLQILAITALVASDFHLVALAVSMVGPRHEYSLDDAGPVALSMDQFVRNDVVRKAGTPTALCSVRADGCAAGIDVYGIGRGPGVCWSQGLELCGRHHLEHFGQDDHRLSTSSLAGALPAQAEPE